jgi:protein-S-isoprenylcysteine O-methyltransferase Ste14
VGLALGALSYLLITWAMAVNRFFAGVVRVQEDRGHQTVSAGPYAVVRHPGYVGMMGLNLAASFTLRSWWALVPAGITMAVTIYRTAMEDRTLRAELAGYEEYAGRTRFRLFPGLW